MIALRLVLAFVWTTYLIDSINTFECCDVLNHKSKSDDCKYSDQTGGVGTCSCKPLPNTRQNWACMVVFVYETRDGRTKIKQTYDSVSSDNTIDKK